MNWTIQYDPVRQSDVHLADDAVVASIKLCDACNSPVNSLDFLLMDKDDLTKFNGFNSSVGFMLKFVELIEIFVLKFDSPF